MWEFWQSLEPVTSRESESAKSTKETIMEETVLRKRRMKFSGFGGPSQWSRPGSIIGYPSFTSARVSNSETRRRRSSVSSPIGLDQELSHKSLTQMMTMRHTPNSGNAFVPSVQGFGSRRFMDKRRSVPHITTHALGPSKLRIAGRSYSSSDTQSDTDSVDVSCSSFGPFPVAKLTASQRRRGSSELMLDLNAESAKSAALLSARNRADLCISAGGSIRGRHRNPTLYVSSAQGNTRPPADPTSAARNDWRSSAPSLLDNLPKVPLSTIIAHEQENQFPALIEKDDTDSDCSQKHPGQTNCITSRDFYRWRRSESAHANNRTTSAYYTPLGRSSFGSSNPWFVSMEESYAVDPETRSVTSTRHTSVGPGKSVVLTGGGQSPQLSLSSMASSLRNSRHMLDVIRGTYELQRRQQQLEAPVVDEKSQLAAVKSLTVLSSAAGAVASSKRSRIPLAYRSLARASLQATAEDFKRQRHSMHSAYTESFDETSERSNRPPSVDQVDSSSRHTLLSLSQADYSQSNGAARPTRNAPSSDSTSAKSFDANGTGSMRRKISPLLSLNAQQLPELMSKSHDGSIHLQSCSTIKSSAIKGRSYSAKFRSGPSRLWRFCSMSEARHANKGSVTGDQEFPRRQESPNASTKNTSNLAQDQKKFQCCLLS
ncbi:hypothetical protein Ciccas_009699 [Cichlidogyrus casuarinus]|uniref:Uncharacterized protein n=1 Tax=Cichlidogyrus casuarinus TaxID=1844966 RepID=A0ABD2PW94_9PLAT